MRKFTASYVYLFETKERNLLPTKTAQRHLNSVIAARPVVTAGRMTEVASLNGGAATIEPPRAAEPVLHQQVVFH